MKKLINQFPAWMLTAFLQWKSPSTSSSKAHSSSVGESPLPNGQRPNLSQFVSIVSTIEKEANEQMEKLAKEGIADGSNGIPAWDSTEACEKEISFDTKRKQALQDVSAEANFHRTAYQTYIDKVKVRLSKIEAGPDQLDSGLEEEKKELLASVEWITEYVHLLGFRINAGQERFKILINRLKNKLRDLENKFTDLEKKYTEIYVGKYSEVGPIRRAIIDDQNFWLVFFVLFSIEVGISFKSIQFFGEMGNSASLLLALVFAGLAAKFVHDCGSALFNWLNYKTQRGKFQGTLTIALIISLILSGFRLNMDGGNVILLVINLLIMTSAGYLAYLRADHEEFFSIIDAKIVLTDKITTVKAQINDVEEVRSAKVKDIEDSFQQKQKALGQKECQLFAEEIEQMQEELLSLNNYERKITSYLRKSYQINLDRYKAFNQEARRGKHERVQRWDNHEK